jgi:hypothetical protein
MAEEKEIKPVKTQAYKVKKEFTLDKLYKVGSILNLPNGKTKDVLISNKFI